MRVAVGRRRHFYERAVSFVLPEDEELRLEVEDDARLVEAANKRNNLKRGAAGDIWIGDAHREPAVGAEW